MEGLVKKIKGIRNEMIGLSIVLMLAGIFMILFPNTSGNIICRGVGAVLCIWGVVRLVAYFRNNEILGSFGLVQGVALAGLNRTTIPKIIIIVDGILKLQYALDFRKLDANGWWIEAVCAAVMIILGIVVLFNPFATVAAVMLFIGVVFVFEGAWDLVSILYISKIAKEFNK